MTKDEILAELKTTFDPKNQVAINNQAKCKRRSHLLKRLYPHTSRHNHRVQLLSKEIPDWRGYAVNTKDVPLLQD